MAFDKCWRLQYWTQIQSHMNAWNIQLLHLKSRDVDLVRDTPLEVLCVTHYSQFCCVVTFYLECKVLPSKVTVTNVYLAYNVMIMCLTFVGRNINLYQQFYYCVILEASYRSLAIWVAPPQDGPTRINLGLIDVGFLMLIPRLNKPWGPNGLIWVYDVNYGLSSRKLVMWYNIIDYVFAPLLPWVRLSSSS